MVKKITLLLLVASYCHASGNLYFIDEDRPPFDENSTPSENHNSEDKEHKPVTPSEYLKKRSTYLLKNKSWWGINISQVTPNLGKAAGFGTESYVNLAGVDKTFTVEVNELDLKNRAVGLSYLMRSHNYAYGLSIDYLKDVKAQVYNFTIVDGGTSYQIAPLDAPSIYLPFTAIPIKFKARYYPTDGTWIQPFFGIGFGATYLSGEFKTASTKKNDSTWSLYSYNLEAGSTFCINENYSIDLALVTLDAQYKSPKAILTEGGQAYNVRLKSPLKSLGIRLSFNIYSGT